MTINNDISPVLLSCLYHCQHHTILGISIKCLIFLPDFKNLNFFPQVLVKVQNKEIRKIPSCGS